MTNTQALKEKAAHYAVQQLVSGMVVGLGTGSTAECAIRLLAQQIRQGILTDIVGIPSSAAAAHLAHKEGIPLGTLTEYPEIDVTIDGLDEVDPQLNLIKGLGGALLREKIVATFSRRVIVIGEANKRVDRLGTRSPLPVEVIPMALWPITLYLQDLGITVVQRLAQDQKTPFVTDEGNNILDCYFANGIVDPYALELALRSRPGIVENGLFLGIASDVMLASELGVEHLRR
ncbi:MAG: ribose-5-phosphate isomerase RpiA [Anaerolineae bacterium]|nr:ribose-5-phosphate isomerase RpiA [Anaerolineae bacterium]